MKSIYINFSQEYEGCKSMWSLDSLAHSLLPWQNKRWLSSYLTKGIKKFDPRTLSSGISQRLVILLALLSCS